MAKDKVKEKKGGRKAKVDPEYLFDLTVDVYTHMLNDDNGVRGGKTAEERVMDKLREKYDKAGALKRYRDQSQIYAPTVRAILTVMLKRGVLPEEAIAKE